MLTKLKLRIMVTVFTHYKNPWTYFSTVYFVNTPEILAGLGFYRQNLVFAVTVSKTYKKQLKLYKHGQNVAKTCRDVWGTCRSESILSRFLRSCLSTASPFRSASISSRIPSTVRLCTTSLLMMWIRNSSSPMSLKQLRITTTSTCHGDQTCWIWFVKIHIFTWISV